MTIYTLSDLPYDHGALEPHISARVMELHHDVHHAAYVKGANEALEQLDQARSSGESAKVSLLERNLAFHLSGHMLHSLLWANMSPDGGRAPEGPLAQQIEADFGSYQALQDQLTTTVSTLQGSGWGMLAWEPMAGQLVVYQVHDHQDHHGVGSVPLLVIDGWEHAYYLDHANDRASWIKAFWQVVDWTSAEAQLEWLTERPGVPAHSAG